MENVEPLEYLYEMLQYITARYGALGIAAAMFAESAGVPFASAIVILTSGTMILRGGVPFWLVFLASTLGITFGSIFSYFLGLLGSMVGNAVRTNYFQNGQTDNEKDNLKNKSKIMILWNRYGNFSIFMAQLWGFTRTFISFPAGAMHMNFYLFTLYTFLGGAIFSLLAISLSLALTSTMSLTIKILRMLAEYSPWLLALLIFIILLIIIIYCVRKRNCKINSLIKFWKK